MVEYFENNGSQKKGDKQLNIHFDPRLGSMSDQSDKMEEIPYFKIKSNKGS